MWKWFYEKAKSKLQMHYKSCSMHVTHTNTWWDLLFTLHILYFCTFSESLLVDGPAEQDHGELWWLCSSNSPSKTWPQDKMKKFNKWLNFLRRGNSSCWELWNTCMKTTAQALRVGWEQSSRDDVILGQQKAFGVFWIIAKNKVMLG